MLQIYCGDGKGKTTAALGLALRAAGSGMRVQIVQFLKGSETSELAALARLGGISILRCDRDYGFFFRMNEEEKAQITACHDRMLRTAWERMKQGEADMLILDEFCAAYQLHLLDRTLADALVFTFPAEQELVLTGRDPEEKFLERADYVSEIRAVKHPYLQGIAARRGIEY